MEQLDKKDKGYKKLEHEVAEFRTDLAGYKMKKEAQLMRMSNKSGDGKGGETNEYMMSKLQDLTIHAQESVQRE